MPKNMEVCECEKLDWQTEKGLVTRRGFVCFRGDALHISVGRKHRVLSKTIKAKTTAKEEMDK